MLVGCIKCRLGDGATDMVVEGSLDDMDPYLPFVCSICMGGVGALGIRRYRVSSCVYAPLREASVEAQGVCGHRGVGAVLPCVEDLPSSALRAVRIKWGLWAPSVPSSAVSSCIPSRSSCPCHARA